MFHKRFHWVYALVLCLALLAALPQSALAGTVTAASIALSGADGVTVSGAGDTAAEVTIVLNNGDTATELVSGGNFSHTFTGLAPGSYTAQVYYTSDGSGTAISAAGAPAVVPSSTAAPTAAPSATPDPGGTPAPTATPVPTPGANDLAITSVTPGVKRVSLAGTGKAGESVRVELFNASGVRVSRMVVIGSDGKFSLTQELDPGAYTQVKVSYIAVPAPGADALYGAFTVQDDPPAPPPGGLTVDPIYTTSVEVIARTSPGIEVKLETKIGGVDYVLTKTADKNGIVRFWLSSTLKHDTLVTVTAAPGTAGAISRQVRVGYAPGAYGILRRGSSGEAVRRLQRHLRDLGYDAAETGYYDSRTEAAVREFQRTNGLLVDGVAGNETQNRLYSVSALAAGTTSGVKYPALARGARGDAVWDLQAKLRELGYYGIRVDGIFGIATQTAVREFQKRNGLPVTGIADDNTQRVLYSGSARPAGSGSGGSYTTLRVGSRGSAVTSLQRRLSSLGYYKGYLDGIFGSQTEAAVRAFQRNNGLSVTGVADPTTQTRVYSSDAIGSSGTSGGGSGGYVYLHWGSTGPAVVRLQTALANLGYYPGRIDGLYYNQTFAAVRAFQRDNGLGVDGLAGRLTQNKLYGTNY
jgi:peptidoglycan hydrolase-like protein with peptidoglycan-binding domain